MEQETIVETYKIVSDGLEMPVHILKPKNAFVKEYSLGYPEIRAGTKALMHSIRDSFISEESFPVEKSIGSKSIDEAKNVCRTLINEIIEKKKLNLDEITKKTITVLLLHEMLGLGKIDAILADSELEEVVVNNATEPLWVYHKKYGWLKSNVFIESEAQVENYANIIARKLGKQISVLNPLLDAHLLTGDRTNATLFPISTKGNTITIRRFRRDPWSLIDLIVNNTASAEVMAFIWEAFQYEMSTIISGGTASGKTTFLGSLMPFLQPYHRIVSIEDTRELALPEFLHWVPLTTRNPNPEGKGEIKMIDLLVNSLRMRPDRIIIGEIRRQEEAEVMFEAIRTGHSVYATFHSDKADEVYKRLTNPPMNLPESVLSALHLIVVQYRHRRKRIRRTLEVAEVVPGEDKNMLNVLYRWNPKEDKLEQISKLHRLAAEINLYTGMSEEEIQEDLKDKIKILDWLVKHQIKTVDAVGKIVAEYYKDEKHLLEIVAKNKSPEEVLGPILMQELARQKE